jgi:hypothetical protein
MDTGIISSSLIADRYDFGEFFLSGYEKSTGTMITATPKQGAPAADRRLKIKKKLPAHRAMNRH